MCARDCLQIRLAHRLCNITQSSLLCQGYWGICINNEQICWPFQMAESSWQSAACISLTCCEVGIFSLWTGSTYSQIIGAIRDKWATCVVVFRLLGKLNWSSEFGNDLSSLQSEMSFVAFFQSFLSHKKSIMMHSGHYKWKSLLNPT